MLRRFLAIGIFCFALLCLGGCNELTSENYDQLRIGMPYDAVVDLLGKPDRCDATVGFKDCTWGDKEKYINVKFGGERVAFFTSKGI
jgi:hypothetical protein